MLLKITILSIMKYALKQINRNSGIPFNFSTSFPDSTSYSIANLAHPVIQRSGLILLNCGYSLGRIIGFVSGVSGGISGSLQNY